MERPKFDYRKVCIFCFLSVLLLLNNLNDLTPEGIFVSFIIAVLIFSVGFIIIASRSLLQLQFDKILYGSASIFLRFDYALYCIIVAVVSYFIFWNSKNNIIVYMVVPLAIFSYIAVWIYDLVRRKKK